MNKEEFVIKTAAEIYIFNRDKTAEEAVSNAEELWEELEFKGYVKENNNI